MRKITAFLVLIAMALPGAAPAQMKAGVVGEAGLGISATPVPTLGSMALQFTGANLSAASLSPALLTPTPAFVTPALAVSVQPAAAKPVTVKAVVETETKIVPAALSAIKPAAATPDKPGSENAIAAGTALFDGAGKLSAPAIGDWFGGSSKSGAKRDSGLSPPTHSELTDAYRKAKPNSKAVEMFGGQFADAAANLVQKYTFMGEYFLQQLNPRSPQYQSAVDLVDAHDDHVNAGSIGFMQLLGRWMAFQDHAQETLTAARLSGRAPAPHLPPSPIPNGEYWDMASGMNAQGFIHRELDPNTKYSFFDYSSFVVSYLKTAAELAGAKNAEVVEADLNKLTKPAKPLAVLRTKNAVHYVPGFDKKLEEMVDWIAPEGQLIIQNDPSPGQRSLIISKHGPVIRRLLSEGWAIEYGFTGYGGKWGRYGLDTLVLTRPKQAGKTRSADETEREWKTYAAAVAKIDADFSPFGSMFR